MESYAVKIEKFEVPGNPGIFKPRIFIKPGMPGFKGVGKELSKEMELESTCRVFSESVEFCICKTAVQQKLPTNMRKEGLNWWTLYQFLVWPHVDLGGILHDGDQLGCLINVFKGQICVRVKIDWKSGHDIGLRPSTPGWTWKSGTYFAHSGF